MYIADLHIHSKYSRATSPEGDTAHLDLWARKKGIGLVGTGDFTHPVWRKELKESLVPAEEGFYTLKDELCLPSGTAETGNAPRFIVTGEISSIYKKNGKTRKIHNLILLPGLDAADAIAAKLETIGNIHSDGRPILGLDSHDLLEIVIETCPTAIFIPAHIWTPHFALFGAFSGFDTIEECFEDLTKEIHAVETGLSSDPPMNWRVSALDRFTLVSNSDAHSPSKLGREANLLYTGLSYPDLKNAIETGDGFGGTIEFFPEEGKYHLDGHRNCQEYLTPEETDQCGGKCPICGKKITIGVLHRVLELADRPAGYRPPDAKPFESLMPLPEVIAESTGNSTASKKTEALYGRMLKELGPEFEILRKLPVKDIERVAGPCVAEGIRRLRKRKVEKIPGYDGKYGEIRLFHDDELDLFSGQSLLFDLPEPCKKDASKTGYMKHNLPTQVQKISKEATNGTPITECTPTALQERQSKREEEKQFPNEKKNFLNKDNLNDEQLKAVTAREPAVAVIAGPGTGKTKTLVSRIAYLIEECGASPSEITAVTFTNKAAAEMRERLEKRLGGKPAIRGLTVGTFHAVCLRLLDKRPILCENEAVFLIQDILALFKMKKPVRDVLRAISDIKNGKTIQDTGMEESVYETYCAKLKDMGLRDLDDLLLDALKLEGENGKSFSHLLVDEFQDINSVQRELVRHWSTGGKSIFVIGDPDQSIYGFRGASASCFSDLQNYFPNLEIISLRENYRSTPEIIAAALHVISRNPGKKRMLEATLPSGTAVRLLKADSSLSEGIWIAKEIAKLTGGLGMLDAQKYVPDQQQIRPFSDIAVLCRTHRQLGTIEFCLRHDSIPYVVSGRGDEFDDPCVQGALALFRFLQNPYDIAALSFCLRFVENCTSEQTEQIVSAYKNDTNYETMQNTCPENTSDSDDLLSKSENIGTDSETHDSGNTNTASKSETANDAFEKKSCNFENLHRLLEKAGCPQEFLAHLDKYLPQIEKKEPHNLLEQWAAEHGKNRAMEHLLDISDFHTTMSDLIAALTLGEEADVQRASGKDYESGAVQLMTLHGSKGLEFPMVFLAGISAKMLPLERKGSSVDQEEERRLFFVGMTRAKEELVLTAAEPYSDFLEELPESVQQSVQHCTPDSRYHDRDEAQQLLLF